MISRSAAQTGGSRHVRFVGCKLSVLDVALSAKGDDNFQNTITELAARGYKHRDRKYLVWMDSNVYCGIGQVYTDDQAGPYNANNGNAPTGMVARVDNGCWGLLHSSYSVEAHELMHTLGAVQPTAPHHSANDHCVDESDTMCYADAPGVVVRKVCPHSQRKLLDCGHDDYFNTQPAPGSYLATHWNAASSAFLEAQPTGGTPGLVGLSPLAGPAGTVVTLTGSSLTPGFGVTLSVTGFAPASGTAGAAVTIKGVGFTGARTVTFNGVPARFSVVSPTVIRATVPRKALKGPVAVTTPAGTTSSRGPFLIGSPARHRRP